MLLEIVGKAISLYIECINVDNQEKDDRIYTCEPCCNIKCNCCHLKDSCLNCYENEDGPYEIIL